MGDAQPDAVDDLLALIEDDALPLQEEIRAIERSELSQLKEYLRKRGVDWASVWTTASHGTTRVLGLKAVLKQRAIQCAQERAFPPAEPSQPPPQSLPLQQPPVASQHGMPQQLVAMPSQQPIAMPQPQPMAVPQPQPIAALQPQPIAVSQPQPIAVPQPQPIAVPQPQPIAVLQPQQSAPVVMPAASQDALIPPEQAQDLWSRFWSRRWAPAWPMPPTPPDGYGSCPGAASSQPSVPPSPPWLLSDTSPMLPEEAAHRGSGRLASFVTALVFHRRVDISAIVLLVAAFPSFALFLPLMGSSFIVVVFFTICPLICVFAWSQLECEFITVLITLGPVLGVCFHFACMPYDFEWTLPDFAFCNIAAVLMNALHARYVPVSVTARRCIPFFPTILTLAPFRSVAIQTRFFVLISTSLCGLIMSEVLSTPAKRIASAGIPTVGVGIRYIRTSRGCDVGA